MITREYVTRHAATRPGAIAVVDRGRDVSYAKFARDIERYIHAVRELGLQRGSVVAVGCDDTYIHWLLLLACEQLALVTVSYLSAEPETTGLLARVDFVLAERHHPTAGDKPHLIIDSEWCRRIFARAADGDGGDGLVAPEDPARIVRTSGTTGVPKYLLLTQRILDLRTAIYMAHAKLDDRSRFLITTPFTVGAGYHHAKACIHAGGTLVIGDFRGRLDMVRTIAAASITHVILWPLQVKQVLDELPPDFPKPAGLNVTSFGAAMAAPLRARLLTRLATTAFDYYGSNESGFISYVPAGGNGEFGLLFPGVDLEVVDENDNPLPAGQIGRIRVKSEFMVGEYWHDPEATRVMYRNGWFYPGDMAALQAERRLQLIGRGDELLNIGGAKVSPGVIEAWVAAHLRARDVGVCTMRNADGIEEICVAVVQPELSIEEVLERITFAFRELQVGSFHVEVLADIPRNPTGKIERGRLRGAIALKGSARPRAS